MLSPSLHLHDARHQRHQPGAPHQTSHARAATRSFIAAPPARSVTPQASSSATGSPRSTGTIAARQDVAVARVQVPPSEASIDAIFRFASSTFFGYDRHGVQGLGVAANAAAEEWEAHRRLPTSVDGLRSALFFEARRWHHYGGAPDEESERYIRELTDHLRRATGGEVRADRNGSVMRLRRLWNRLLRRP